MADYVIISFLAHITDDDATMAQTRPEDECFSNRSIGSKTSMAE
jgi:hypothetical protein